MVRSERSCSMKLSIFSELSNTMVMAMISIRMKKNVPRNCLRIYLSSRVNNFWWLITG